MQRETEQYTMYERCAMIYVVNVFIVHDNSTRVYFNPTSSFHEVLSKQNVLTLTSDLTPIEAKSW